MIIRKQECLIMILATACSAVLLTGCGGEETVHTGADAQTEAAMEASADEEAEETVHTGADAQTEAATEASADEEAEDQEDGNKEALSAKAESAQQRKQTDAQTDVVKSRAEVDEELRRELTAELLEEENLDTSVMESGRITKGCSFELPEGFEESEEVENMYVTKRYPIDASTIYYAVMEEDISQQLLTEESFKEKAEEDLKQAFEEEIEISIDSFERVRISGYPAFRILCHYKVGEIEITQLEYAVNADNSYMITYSQTSDYDYMEAYEASAATIRVN